MVNGAKCLSSHSATSDSSAQANPFIKMKSLIHFPQFADTWGFTVVFWLICPIVCPILYLSSSISRLDSLSDSCLHRASLRSISLWSFLCRRMFSSLMCRSSSMYWARFSVSVRRHTEQMTSVEILSHLGHYISTQMTALMRACHNCCTCKNP